MAWGKEWPNNIGWPIFKPVSKEEAEKKWPSKPVVPEGQLRAGEAYIKQFTDVYGTEPNPVALGIKEYNNKVPTHDPYSNPDSHIYYECGCGVILDPGTKSFASLNNAAMNAGWKVRWGADSYVPYCVKCGEGVE